MNSLPIQGFYCFLYMPYLFSQGISKSFHLLQLHLIFKKTTTVFNKKEMLIKSKVFE